MSYMLSSRDTTGTINASPRPKVFKGLNTNKELPIVAMHLLNELPAYKFNSTGSGAVDDNNRRNGGCGAESTI